MQKKPWSERKVAQLLLSGQGGSGKTHVAQKTVAIAGAGQDRHDGRCCSSAQAKNVSTETVAARTLHKFRCTSVRNRRLCHASPEVHQHEASVGGHAQKAEVVVGARLRSCYRGDKYGGSRA
eukprot:6964666-Pyramimonas_sp.AAC.1